MGTELEVETEDVEIGRLGCRDETLTVLFGGLLLCLESIGDRGQRHRSLERRRDNDFCRCGGVVGESERAAHALSAVGDRRLLDVLAELRVPDHPRVLVESAKFAQDRLGRVNGTDEPDEHELNERNVMGMQHISSPVLVVEIRLLHTLELRFTHHRRLRWQ